jgi:hypothetical protein
MGVSFSCADTNETAKIKAQRRRNRFIIEYPMVLREIIYSCSQNSEEGSEKEKAKML